jgi:transcription-repair coupling factor (superfamily II helicase)
LQKDVSFKNLGLLVVDEEQRFGVRQKERMKERFKAVDVLTLSATPIPRTLNMALGGIRDMSVIEEAPKDRLPVQTYVCEYNQTVIKDAILKEIRRQGQVFYLHNRIEDIEKKAEFLKSEIPGLRVVCAHGRMAEKELIFAVSAMLNKEADVLVCTTIIESGTDIPNVNTIIVEDADNLGLSQLHQIRGRVGRSYKRAFAYFMYRRGKVLSEEASKRLAPSGNSRNSAPGLKSP